MALTGRMLSSTLTSYSIITLTKNERIIISWTKLAQSQSHTTFSQHAPPNPVADLVTPDEIKDTKGLRIVSWNINTLAPKINAVREFANKIKPDVICIQELWQPQKNISLTIPGYHDPVLRQRKASKGGGVATYVRSNIAINKHHSPFIEKICETQMLTLTVKKKSYTILNCYLGQLQKTTILDTLFQFISNLKQKNMIILGDFNIDMLQVDSNPDSTRFSDGQ